MSEPETPSALHAGDALLIPLADGLMIETPAGEDSATVRGADLLLLARVALQHAAPDGGPLFTWEMVEAMRTAAGGYRSGDFNGFNDWNDVQADLLEVAAARLASLLPPRTEPEP